MAIIERLTEFKGMLCSQKLVFYTDHQNLIRDALGLNSGRVYGDFFLKNMAQKSSILRVFTTQLQTHFHALIMALRQIIKRTG